MPDHLTQESFDEAVRLIWENGRPRRPEAEQCVDTMAAARSAFGPSPLLPAFVEYMRRDGALTETLAANGLRRIAASMVAPISRPCDFQHIGRTLLATETMPADELPVYDSDMMPEIIVSPHVPPGTVYVLSEPARMVGPMPRRVDVPVPPSARPWEHGINWGGSTIDPHCSGPSDDPYEA
jgi:hypothetical protein